MSAAIEARGVPDVAQLVSDYRAKLTQAARAAFTTEDLLTAWLKAAEAEVSSSYVKSLRHRTKHLPEYLAQHGLHLLDVDREQANRYVRWMAEGKYAGRRSAAPLEPYTVLTNIKAASSLFNWLTRERGLALTNPFHDLGRLYKRKNRASLYPSLRALDERETALFLEGAETLDDFLVVFLPFKTLARREECAGIRMDRINWNTRTIQLDPHPKRTFLTLYFDEELEFFLRLKCERNARDHPGNPYLFPSPKGKDRHVSASSLLKKLQDTARRSPLAATMRDRASRVTFHTGRRSGTSVLKRARPTAPSGVPSHIVAVLRGDSLLSRNENTPDPTQGIYTRMGKLEGVDEVRWWYDRGMPKVGARDAWERAFPSRQSAASVAALIRAAKAGTT